MPEHTPAPTPDRAVYGFGLYLLFYTLFIVYVIYAFVPQSILENHLGLTYLPDKYFALYIPILILCGTTFFAFFIYPGLNMSLTPGIEDPIGIRDSYSIVRCRHFDADGRKCDNQVEQIVGGGRGGWEQRKFCKIHGMHRGKGDSNVDQDAMPRKEDDEIQNWCDCPPDHRCLLRENPEHVKQLQGRTKIPAIYDMDLADVCQEVFGGD